MTRSECIVNPFQKFFVDQPAPALSRLKNAKAARRPWAAVAEAIIELEQNSAADAGGTPWLYRAAEASGYGSNQLRRMVRAHTLLGKLSDSLTDQQIRIARTMPVSSVEVIMRLHAVNPDLALTELSQAIVGRGSTYRDLLAIYEQAASSETARLDAHKAGHRMARAFEDVCGDLVRRDLFQFTGSISAQIIRPARNSFEFVHPDLVLVQSDLESGKPNIVDAVEIHAATSHSYARALSQTRQEVAFGATFFRRFWLMVPDGPVVADLDNDFTRLGLNSVGIAAVNTTGEPVWRVQRLPHGPPVPDRRGLLSI